MKFLKIVKPNGDIHFGPAESMQDHEQLQKYKQPHEKNVLSLIEESEMNAMIESGELKATGAVSANTTMLVNAQKALHEKDSELAEAKAAQEAAIQEAEELKAELAALKAAKEVGEKKEKKEEKEK